MNYLSAFGLPLERKKCEAYRERYTTIQCWAFSSMANHPGYSSLEQSTRRDKHMTSEMGVNCENVVTPGQQESVFPVNGTNESTLLGRNIGSHVGSMSEESVKNASSHVGSMSEESVKKASSHVGATPTRHARILTTENLQEITCYVHKAAATWENLYSDIHMYRGLEHLTDCSPGMEEDIVKISSHKGTGRSNTPAELINSMYNLSVMLLCACTGGYELDDSEHAFFQSAIQYLNALSSKKSKVQLVLIRQEKRKLLIGPNLGPHYANGEVDDSSKQQNHVKESKICSATLGMRWLRWAIS